MGNRPSTSETIRKDSVSPKWEVKDGVLTLTGRGWRRHHHEDGVWSPSSSRWITGFPKGGNSGSHVSCQGDGGDVRGSTGPEIQIQDNVDGHDAQKAGWLYQLYRPAKGVDATQASRRVEYS